MLLDHFGWLGTEKTPVTWQRCSRWSGHLCWCITYLAALVSFLYL
ncbi:hypothetical protein J547_03833 [Acinetobacter baumannii 110912]|nr:hypothetical protein J547_03833 [Acinetobacter baumannii 110912]